MRFDLTLTRERIAAPCASSLIIVGIVFDAADVACIRSRATPSATHRSTSPRSGTQTRSRSRNVGATKNRNRRNVAPIAAKARIDQSEGNSPRVRYATRLGQTSPPPERFASGRITANARRMIGQKSSGVYMTSIQAGAFLRARANPVVVVVVRRNANPVRARVMHCASFNAIATSPTLTACSHVGRLFESRSRSSLIVNPQTLSKFSPVTSAAKHLHQIARQKEQQPDWPKQIVDKTDHSITDPEFLIANPGKKQDLGGPICFLANQMPLFHFREELQPAVSPKGKSHLRPLIETTLRLPAVL